MLFEKVLLTIVVSEQKPIFELGHPVTIVMQVSAEILITRHTGNIKELPLVINNQIERANNCQIVAILLMHNIVTWFTFSLIICFETPKLLNLFS